MKREKAAKPTKKQKPGEGKVPPTAAFASHTVTFKKLTNGPKPENIIETPSGDGKIRCGRGDEIRFVNEIEAPAVIVLRTGRGLVVLWDGNTEAGYDLGGNFRAIVIPGAQKALSGERVYRVNASSTLKPSRPFKVIFIGDPDNPIAPLKTKNGGDPEIMIDP